VNLYWLGGNNFGDALTPVLYKMMTGEEPALATTPPRTFCIGSIATIAQPGDTLWGTGTLRESDIIHPDVAALAVRGPLTDALLPSPCGVYGDPSLLLPQFHTPMQHIGREPRVVPHYTDRSREFPIAMVDIYYPPFMVIQDIASSLWVASSSLHGLSVAEAYRVPAVWVEFSNEVAGKGFKFRDYYLGTGREPPEPVDCRKGMNIGVIEKMVADWVPPVIDPRLLEVCPWRVYE